MDWLRSRSFFGACLFLLFVSLIFLFAPHAEATFGEKKTIVVSQEETINETYFAKGETIIISGTINNDAYITGAQVTIDGEINGDLFVAGGNVVLNGRVIQDARIAGGQITINGAVERNLTVLGGNSTISNTARINGSVIGANGNITISSPVPDEVAIAAGNATIDSAIGKDLRAMVGNLTLGANARIGNDLTYWSDEMANLQSGAQIGGDIMYHSVDLPKGDKWAGTNSAIMYNTEQKKQIIASIMVTAAFISILASMLLGYVLFSLFPIYVKKTTDIIDKRPLTSIGVGFIALIAMPITALLLMATVIGFPLGLVVLLSYGLMLCLGKVLIAYFVGLKIFTYFDKKTKKMWYLLLGLVCIELLSFIPLIGALVKLIVLVTGLGILVLTKKTLYHDMRHHKMV